MVSVTLFEQVYDVYTLEEIGKHTQELGKKILKENGAYDRVVALARGGVSIAQSLSDFVGVKRISVVQSEVYSGVYQKKTPIIVQPLAANIKGESILLIDDLADSGETLLFACDYLKAHGPSKVTTVTLACKPWTKYTPDFWQLSSEAWIIFPWEVRETIQTLWAMWEKKGIEVEKRRDGLNKLGFTKDQIELFTHS